MYQQYISTDVKRAKHIKQTTRKKGMCLGLEVANPTEA